MHDRSFFGIRGRRPLAVAAAISAALIAVSGMATASSPAPVADLVLLHGNVIPMTAPDAKAEAIAVKGGRIIAIGSDAEIAALRGKATIVVDLDGKTVLPGFIDAHGHITGMAQIASTARLAPPPVDDVADIATLQAALRAQAGKHPDGWIVGFGYDDAQLAERRHPVRQDLDAVSTERPVIAVHVSGHLAVLNSKALELTGMLHPGPDPAGGVIRREADGKTASGVVEETALFRAMAALPAPSLDQSIEHLRTAQRIYAGYGITTAQDGATMPAEWALLNEAAKRSALFIDIHSLPLMSANWPALEALPFGAPYANHLRVAGVKIVLDGSPQGQTAWLSHPYFKPPHDRPADYSGYARFPDAELHALLARAARNNWQAYVHVNGDAAIQQLIEGVRWTNRELATPMHRTIAIHAQTARRDQLEAMKTLDIEPSFFASHTFYWGDWHRETVLGPVLAERISPQRDAFDLGLRPTIHNDLPVVPPDIIRLIWSATTRRTRSNDILGPAERVTPYEALEEVTKNAAYEIHEEAGKGTLEPGKLADLVILDGDPLTLPREDLLRLRVSGTVKEGRFVFRASGPGAVQPR